MGGGAPRPECRFVARIGIPAVLLGCGIRAMGAGGVCRLPFAVVSRREAVRARGARARLPVAAIAVGACRSYRARLQQRRYNGVLNSNDLRFHRCRTRIPRRRARRCCRPPRRSPRCSMRCRPATRSRPPTAAC
ncbi:hypothetical protein BVI434_2120040 [Burkholderia vietnamiensis]|nr:hypothetical protein BVI434_2120040 [Burkholderia vietnamiensis]